MTLKVWNLGCEQGHLFEGWFRSQDDYEQQRGTGFLSCPLCGSAQVSKRPTAARLGGLGREAAEPLAQPESQPAAPREQGGALALDPQALREMWRGVQARLAAVTEDVGAGFADEARAIHHGDAPARPIRGQATPAEREALADEGVDVVALPWLDEGGTH